jgi:hypothetical protein
MSNFTHMNCPANANVEANEYHQWEEEEEHGREVEENDEPVLQIHFEQESDLAHA